MPASAGVPCSASLYGMPTTNLAAWAPFSMPFTSIIFHRALARHALTGICSAARRATSPQPRRQYWVIQVSSADEFAIRIIAASSLGEEDALVPPDQPLLRSKMICLDVDSGRKTAGTAILKWYAHSRWLPGQVVEDKPTQNFAMMHRFDYASPVRFWIPTVQRILPH